MNDKNNKNNDDKVYIQGGIIKRIPLNSAAPEMVSNVSVLHPQPSCIEKTVEKKNPPSIFEKIWDFAKSEEAILIVLILLLMQENTKDDILIIILVYLLLSDGDFFGNLFGNFKFKLF